jgi:hypothetical protein
MQAWMTLCACGAGWQNQTFIKENKTTQNK